MTINYLASKVAGSDNQGDLTAIPDCYIRLPGKKSIDQNDLDKVLLYALPEIQESKSAQYSDTTIAGRSSPIKTYSYSSNRTIGLTIHLFVTKTSDIQRNTEIIRRISSLVHPEYNNTYLPPKIAKLKCAQLIADDEAPVLLKNYTVRYETDVQWFSDGKRYMPLHVSISTDWDVVYNWNTLPGSSDVLKGKY